ncbi:MAG: ComF family protein [Spirochaetales bacterium]|nr:ComF family protein [Spirochaetales bacterium]
MLKGDDGKPYSVVFGLRRITSESCHVCGCGLISEQQICLKCRQREFFFDRNISVFYYWGDLVRYIYQLKNRKNRRVMVFFASVMARKIRALFPGYLVIPVPCRPANRRKRGYDQLWLIADYLAKYHNIETKRLLYRKNGGKSQKQLNSEARRENIKNRFSYHGMNLNGRNCLLIDDVFTTGATLDECARILLEHGAGKVNCLTIARD